MSRINKTIQGLMAAAVLLGAVPARADEGMSSALLAIENRWAEIRYEMKDKKQKLEAGKALAVEAEAAVARHPGKAEPLIWHALALLIEAEVRADISALSVTKKAKALLENAQSIDTAALDGMIHTTLGMMYYEVPGWPIGFGDKKKAVEHLSKALEIDPHGLDTNYFYGDYLVMNRKGREALPYLEKAAQVLPRPGHERADAGRKTDVQDALERARKAR
jgi:tetratricopeptide (TPR) repeat protein